MKNKPFMKKKGNYSYPNVIPNNKNGCFKPVLEVTPIYQIISVDNFPQVRKIYVQLEN